MSAFLERRLAGVLIVCAIASLALPATAQTVPPNPVLTLNGVIYATLLARTRRASRGSRVT